MTRHDSLFFYSRCLFLASTAALLQGCVSLLPPNNQAITAIDGNSGYRVMDSRRKPAGDHQVILAFSGGGTRAAALSYGVLQELRDTRVDNNVRLLDEVDVISSVSGGSFTAAYYGLYGDDIFKNYERDFLRKSVQSSLLGNLLSPSYWFHAMFSGINRTDMAVDYYNRTIFHDATFNDIPREQRPFIEINATDLATGAHFAFTQGYFDLLCTDLATFPIARAVTASSGVPMAFPPVTLKNHADQCDVRHSYLSDLVNKNTFDNTREEDLLTMLQSYTDVNKRPFVHLIDGGVSDNLGLRSVLDRYEVQNMNPQQMYQRMPVKNVLVILVNAEVKPANPISQSYQPPSMLKTAGALTDALISRYTVETRTLAKAQLQAVEKQMHEAGYDVHFYFVEVDFAALESPGLQQFFNNLPTTLELSDSEIDILIDAGRELLRQSEPFQQFLARNRGLRVESLDPKKPCSLSNPTGCVFD